MHRVLLLPWLCILLLILILSLIPSVPAEAQDQAVVPAAPTGAPPATERIDRTEPVGGGEPGPSVGAEPAGYGEAIDAAVREHELGHFVEARELLLRAHKLYPNARTLRGLGKVEYELRNYGHAVEYLQRALASPERPLDARLRADVEEVLARARAYVGEVHVNVDPGTASVIVDGITVASGPEASLRLLVGDHVIEFRADGRLPERRAVRVNGGEEMQIQVVLSPPQDLSVRGTPERTLVLRTPEQAPREDRPVYKNPWLWTGVGIVVAGAVTAIAIAATRDRDTLAEPFASSSGVVLENQ